jgi:glycosyltransferase involved in cell wall biosynthesis
MSSNSDKIKCSIGILTCNSSETLRRCLESVKRMDDIIIADGGSIDNTRAIAEEYGCNIISQVNKSGRIEDFSLERNNTLQSAKCDWFFYLDSDEYMSPELVDEIEGVINRNDHFAYKVRYLLTSGKGEVYHSFKSYYQVRLFSKQSGGYFIKKAHEKIHFAQGQITLGKIESPWYVPLDDTDLRFDNYRRKVLARIPDLLSDWKDVTLAKLLKKLLRVVIDIIKQLFKMILLRLRYGSKELVPFRYELYRLFSQYVLLRELVRHYSRKR